MVKPILSIDEIPRQGSIFIYGTGSVGQFFLDILRKFRKDVQVVFLDSFTNGNMAGYVTLRFKDFLVNSTRNETIVVASSFWPEISRSLSEAGFKHVSQAFDLFEFSRDTGLQIRLPVEE